MDVAPAGGPAIERIARPTPTGSSDSWPDRPSAQPYRSGAGEATGWRDANVHLAPPRHAGVAGATHRPSGHDPGLRRAARRLFVVGLGDGSAASPAASTSRMLLGQAMTPCLVQGEIPVKAEVAGCAGPSRCPKTARPPRVAVSTSGSRASRRSPRFPNRTPSSHRRRSSDASTSFFAWLPGHVHGHPCDARHRARRPAWHRGVERPDAAADADTSGLSASAPMRGWRRGCATAWPHRCRPAVLHEHGAATTSTTSGRRSGTTGSTCTGRRMAGRSRSTTSASTRSMSASRCWTADAARRAGPGADRRQQPGRARPRDLAMRRGRRVPRGLSATR